MENPWVDRHRDCLSRRSLLKLNRFRQFENLRPVKNLRASNPRRRQGQTLQPRLPSRTAKLKTEPKKLRLPGGSSSFLAILFEKFVGNF